MRAVGPFRGRGNPDPPTRPSGPIGTRSAGNRLSRRPPSTNSLTPPPLTAVRTGTKKVTAGDGPLWAAEEAGLLRHPPHPTPPRPLPLTLPKAAPGSALLPILTLVRSPPAPLPPTMREREYEYRQHASLPNKRKKARPGWSGRPSRRTSPRSGNLPCRQLHLLLHDAGTVSSLRASCLDAAGQLGHVARGGMVGPKREYLKSVA